MNKIYALLVVITISTLTFSAQAKKQLQLIDINDIETEDSRYSRIQIVDDRPEIEKKELSFDQELITRTVNSLLDRNLNNKTLTIQIRKLYLQKDNKRNTYLLQVRAFMNETNRKSYHWLNTLNESFYNDLSFDETDEEIAASITQFVNDNLQYLPTDSDYSREYITSDFNGIAHLEKKQIPVFQTDNLQDGIYFDYQSFANQTPNITSNEISKVKFKEDLITEIQCINKSNNKNIKLKNETIYGIVLEGKFYIQQDKKFMPLTRDENNDFCFIATKTKVSSAASYGMFGLIGALVIPTNTTKESSKIIVDHLSGELTLKHKNVEKRQDSIFRSSPKIKKSGTIQGDGSTKKSW